MRLGERLTTSGKHFTELKDAQEQELATLLNVEVSAVTKALVENAESVLDILSTTQTSKVRARKIHGGTKTRKPKPTAQPEPTPA